MVISQEDGVSKKQLMLNAAELENMLKEKERIGREINIEQSRVVGNDNYSRDMSSQAGNENWREKHIWKAMEGFKVTEESRNTDDGRNRSDEEEVDNGPNKVKERPKGKKWKSQARVLIKARKNVDKWANKW